MLRNIGHSQRRSGLAIAAKVLPPVEVFTTTEVSATNLNFGDVQVKALKTLDRDLQHWRRRSDYRRFDILSDPDRCSKFHFPPRPHNIHPGDTPTFQLGFRPDTAGVQSAALAITNNDPDPQDRLRPST